MSEQFSWRVLVVYISQYPIDCLDNLWPSAENRCRERRDGLPLGFRG